jgi:hypothetical protein
MLTHEDVRHLCGELPDWKIAKIIASKATYHELETAVLWTQGENRGPEERHMLGSQAAYLYEILMAGEEWEEEEGR